MSTMIIKPRNEFVLPNSFRKIHQRRSFLSLIQKPHILKDSTLQPALDHAVSIVRKHDPAGYLPGKLLATNDLQVAYFAVRSFWIETGLRFGTTALVPPHSSPAQHLRWWQMGIEQIYENPGKLSLTSENHDHYHDHHSHPTFQLLLHLLQEQKQQQQQSWTRCHFEDILKGRFRDLDTKQYPDMAALEQHAEWSCGSLMQLLLESDGRWVADASIAHRAAKLLGKAHGLTNALRTSIPVISTTGKLVIPQELCETYGVKSPRYLLSALGQGDAECSKALRHAVQDIAQQALLHLQEARDLRQEILSTTAHHPEHIWGIFLPGLASEAFLQRLKAHNYDLTDHSSRNVSWVEHLHCSLRMIYASYRHEY